MEYKITGPATSELIADGLPPITVIGTEEIRNTFDEATLQQAINARSAPGISEVILNPDAHIGYGAPIGCVMVSPDHIYPGPVGVDVKCSMSLIQFDLPEEEIRDKRIRRDLINAICARTPTGPGQGQRNVPKSRHIPLDLAVQALIEGPSPSVCEQMGIPFEWTERCEDAFHRGHDRSEKSLKARLERITKEKYLSAFREKMRQLGSYGGGNHFGECEITQIEENDRARKCAEVFGLKDGQISFLSHCGSRGFGNIVAVEQFRILREYFKKTGTPFPGGDTHLVYARCGSHEGDDYLDDMALAANFATVNHLLINTLIVEAFQEIFPDVQAKFIYLISHNIVRREVLDGQSMLVHRKGATRAFPAGHPGLEGTPFESTGHPILLPGNPVGGSAVMVADPGARLSCFSINHGAGRVLGRRDACRTLNQKQVNLQFDDSDILVNCRNYPLDESPAAYKNFDEVIKSVQEAGLASVVARLKARFVIKDGDKPDD
ncbi:MAG: RtcB family protein [Planctomycetia bacterium]|nr:RtcB family protein [Planctomycetia bacterium]